MLTFVMSGAANFGAMQAGALEAILERDIRPRMLVGSSAGALNAIYLGLDPSLEGVYRLQDVWRAAGPDRVGIPKALSAVRRMVTQRDSLVDNGALARFLQERLPSEIRTFGELTAHSGARAYAVAVCMETGQLVAFGDRPQDLLLDGAMASAAVPPYFPPWEVDQRHYLDGGVYAKLPLRVALDRGATQILALDVSHAMGSRETAQGVLGISGYALSLMVEAQAAQEIAMTHARGVALRVLRLRAPQDVTFWDYTQADRLIRAGREIARKMLDQEPVLLRPPWWLNLRRRLASTFASRRLGWSLALEEEFKEGGEADRARRGEEGE